jgi:SagB-type dehydrogenase family enzyme
VPGQTSLALTAPVVDAARLERYQQRRSQRQFSLRPIGLTQLGEFLSVLQQLTLDGKPKYLYASPGGLYPVQVYLHIKPGRVEGVAGGSYYYHPIEHRLVLLHEGIEIDRSIHVPFINTPIFDEAAFSLLLIGRLDAIGPSYGELSLHFITLEAGGMAHLLEMAGPPVGIGLCQIGTIEFDRIRQHFDLDDSHVLVHSLLGGLIDKEEVALPTGQDDASKVAHMVERIKRLSPEEVRALLEANRARRP